MEADILWNTSTWAITAAVLLLFYFFYKYVLNSYTDLVYSTRARVCTLP